MASLPKRTRCELGKQAARGAGAPDVRFPAVCPQSAAVRSHNRPVASAQRLARILGHQFPEALELFAHVLGVRNSYR